MQPGLKLHSSTYVSTQTVFKRWTHPQWACFSEPDHIWITAEQQTIIKLELDISTWEGWLLPVVIRGTAASGSMVWFSVASFLHQTDVKQLKVRALTWPLVWACVDFLCAQTKASVRVKEKLLVKYEVLLVMSSVTLTLIALGAQSAWQSAHGCTLTVTLCGKEPLLNASTVNIM